MVQQHSLSIKFYIFELFQFFINEFYSKFLIAAVASIVGASELYVRTGSTISLECVIQGAGSIPPRVLFWFHNGKPIALDSPRGGISLTTSRDTGISPGMSSKLLLTRATMADGGNYTCAPPGAQSANITVHVLNGNHLLVIYLSRYDYLSIIG